MSDQLLTRLARLDRDKLFAKLAELEQQRRIIVALIRSKPRRRAMRSKCESK